MRSGPTTTILRGRLYSYQKTLLLPQRFIEAMCGCVIDRDGIPVLGLFKVAVPILVTGPRARKA